MKREKYLYRRSNSQFWQVRVMVPKEARVALGRSEFTKSLGVTDKAKAEMLAHSVLAGWKAQIANALEGIALPVEGYIPSREELEEAAVFIGVDRANERAETLIKAKAEQGEKAFDALRERVVERRKAYIRMASAGELSQWLIRARRECASRGWALNDDSPELRQFAELICKAAIDGLANMLARVDGAESTFVASPFVHSVKTRKDAKARPGETISDLFERFAQQRYAEGRKRTDTIEQDRKVISQFAEFIGSDRSVRSILPAEVRDWRDTLATTPPNFGKMTKYAGLSLREVSEKAKAGSDRFLSPTTINKYLSTVSPFFGWCVVNGHSDRNPCDGLFYDLAKGKNPRPPFSVAQINAILASPLFTGFAVDGKEHEAGSKKADDWRFWIPLICLFTGARIGEIAQLHKEDVKQEHGVWFIHIRDDEAKGQRTKSGVSRPAPVHSILQRIGFLEFFERQRAKLGGTGPLFPELKPNARGHIGAAPSRFWRNYLKAIGIKEGRDGLGAHSFRHTLADQLRLADYLDDEIEVALGHNQKTVTSGYGALKQGTVSRLHTMFEAVKFEGVDFTPLLDGRDEEQA